MKGFLKYCCVFCCLIAGYLLFQFSSCLLPNKYIRHHIAESVVGLAIPGDYPNALIENDNCKMDNFTDALILSMAYHIDDLNVQQILQSMFNPKFSVIDETYTMYNNLYAIVTYNLPPTTSYGRYWHGSTYLIRYLLMIFDYNHIRYILYMITTLLLITVCYRLYQMLIATNGTRIAFLKTIGFISGFLLLNGIITQFSIQYAPVIILSLTGTLFVFKYFNNSSKMMMVLFVTGSLTSFFDLLTIPLLTLGLPLLAYVLLRIQNEYNLRNEYKLLTFCSLLWLAGYTITWVSKWVLATLFTSENVINNALNAANERSSSTDYTRFDAIFSNMSTMPWLAVIIILSVLVILAIVFYKRNEIQKLLIFLPFILAPYIWYFCLANHSYLHRWFTYRAQIISVSAAVLVLSGMIDWQKIKNIKLKKTINKIGNE